MIEEIKGMKKKITQSISNLCFDLVISEEKNEELTDVVSNTDESTPITEPLIGRYTAE